MSITTPTRSPGRPQARYRTISGEYVEGLSRDAEGRWRNSLTGQRWREPDEGRAVEQFREHLREAGLAGVPKGQRGFRGIAVHEGSAGALFDRDERREEVMIISLSDHGDSPTGEIHVEDEDGNTVTEPDGRVLVMPLEPQPEQWEWIRQKIVDNPVWVAQKLKIAEIANLQNVKPKQPSPTLKEVITTYTRRRESQISPAELTKHESSWELLAKSLRPKGMTTLREWTKEAVSGWGESLVARYKPKTVKHHILRVRAVLKEYRTTLDPGDRLADAAHAMECLAVLRPPKQASPDKGHPMSPETFRALLDAAGGFTSRKENLYPHANLQWQAMLLMSANACLYLKDLACLRWDALDLTNGMYSDRREKTGEVARGACLWKRTVDALIAWRDAQSELGELVFPSPRDTMTTSTILGKTYNRLRECAKVKVAPDTHFSAIRDRTYDAAYWASDQSSKYALVLAGHRTPGITDAYVLRHPGITAGVCQHVERVYFGEQAKGLFGSFGQKGQ